MRIFWHIWLACCCFPAVLTAQAGIALVAGTPHEATEISYPATRYYAPVALKHNLVWVRASVNGRTGWFLLDTGAPVILWHHPAPVGQEATVVATGVAGSAGFAPARFDFQWGHLDLQDISGLSGDLSGLAELNGQAVEGIIGMQVLRHSRLTLDFARQTLLLETRPAPPAAGASPLYEWPLQWEGHLPVVEMKAGGKTLRLGIDTGASVNLLDECRVPRRARKAGGQKDQETVLLQFLGMEGRRWPVRQVDLLDGEVGLRQSFVCLPFRQMAEEMALDIDGLLGFPFLSQYRVVLDFEHGVLQLWSSK